MKPKQRGNPFPRNSLEVDVQLSLNVGVQDGAENGGIKYSLNTEIPS